MVTVKELREYLDTLDDNLEIVIYPKYSSDKVDGFKKHTFRIDQVCVQSPYAISIRNNQEKLDEYFNGEKTHDYQINKHIAIIF